MLIFELSQPGRRNRAQARRSRRRTKLEIPERFLRREPPLLPEVSELDAVRHYTALSQNNFSIDTHFYPLGFVHDEVQPARLERGGDAAAVSRAPPRRARRDGPGLSRVSVRAAGNAEGGDGHGGGEPRADGRRAGRARRRRDDPRVSRSRAAIRRRSEILVPSAAHVPAGFTFSGVLGSYPGAALGVNYIVNRTIAPALNQSQIRCRSSPRAVSTSNG